MSKVYVLSKGVPGEAGPPVGVYATEEAAVAAMIERAAHDTRITDPDSWFGIDEFEVEGGETASDDVLKRVPL